MCSPWDVIGTRETAAGLKDTGKKAGGSAVEG